ncbi:MAG TPA: DUF58 domain-containing protein [Tepidisphaeraceae bacterium]|jgi:uncharacterized protein (DUF58 family)
MTQIAAQPGFASLLDPAALAKISKMELVSSRLMDGYVQGLHRSPHLGFALDFAQHRQYVPGDDIKRIDWRAYAKADRYYIKQYEVSTDLHAHIVLDASGSMAYQGAADVMSKFRYAQFVAACLSYLVLHQQDSAGLVTFDNKVREMIPARSTPSHLLQIVRTLDNTKAEKESAIAPLLHDIAERIKRRGIVIILSDFFDRPDAIIEALHHLRHKRHEVLMLHIMADDEIRFPFRKWSLFENLEQREHRLRLDPATMRTRYLENVASYMKVLREGVAKLAISHVLLNTSRPFDDALVTYLAGRMGKR